MSCGRQRHQPLVYRVGHGGLKSAKNRCREKRRDARTARRCRRLPLTRASPSANAQPSDPHQHPGLAIHDGFRRPATPNATTGHPHAGPLRPTRPKPPRRQQDRLERRYSRGSHRRSAIQGTRRSRAPGPEGARVRGRYPRSGAAPPGAGKLRPPHPIVCRARAPTRRGNQNRRNGHRPKAGKSLCLQGDTRRSTRDYSIGGSASQHSASWRQTDRPCPPSPHPTWQWPRSRAGGVDAGEPQPAPARSTPRIDPRRSASASGSSSRGPRGPDARQTSRRSGCAMTGRIGRGRTIPPPG
jgi:hypothetical protein